MNTSDSSRKWLKDGVLDFSGGVDGGRPASDIDKDQCSFAINTTMRGGVAKPRPGWVRRTVTLGTDIADYWNNGRFQDAGFYDGTGTPFLMSSHGGRQFKVNIKTWVAAEITPTKLVTTNLTVAFTVPAVGASATLNVSSTSGADLRLTSVTVGAYTLTLTAIVSGTQLTVTNADATAVGSVVAIGGAVTYSKYDCNSAGQELGWNIQAENYWIYQDNQSYPVVFDGGGSRRADPAKKEIPVGNIMCYAQGRILVVLPDRETFRAGDLVFGSSGTPANGYRDAILRFTENDYLNEGGDFIARVFGAPSNSGKIRSMKACAQTDSSLGQGSVLVGTPNVVFSLNLPFDRTTWKNMASALQTVNPIIGPTGHNSTVLINTDMWYRGIDGVRSYIMAQRQFNAYGNTPISSEVGPTLSYDTEFLLEHGSAVLFDNRLLMTVSPVRTNQHGVYHRGLVVMDFNLVSSLRHKTSPAWEGVWTGPRILKLVDGMIDNQQRCFAYVLNDSSQIEIWELTKDAKDDDGTAIEWSPELRSMNCGDSDRFKRLETARAIVQNISGTLTGTLEYITDQGPCWQPWDTFSVCSKNEDCGPGPCSGPHTYREQHRYPIRFKRPPDTFNTVSKRKYNTGYEFQPRIRFSGYGELKQFRIYCLDEPEMLGIDDRTQT